MPVCPDVSVQYGSLSYWNQTNGKNTTGTVVRVTCQHGRQPVGGHSVAICNSKGQWDPNPPDCGGQFHNLHQLQSSHITVLSIFFPSTVACSRLSLPANVITNTSSNAPGVTVNFSCKNGNILGNAAITCLHNGSWSGSVPYCTSGNPFPSCCTFTTNHLFLTS